MPGHCGHREQDHQGGEVEGEDRGGDPRHLDGGADGGGGGAGGAEVRRGGLPHADDPVGARGQEGVPHGAVGHGGGPDGCARRHQGRPGGVQLHRRE